MKSLLLASLLAASALTACAKKSTDAAATAEASVPTVTVDELDANLAKNAWEPVDANGEQTRKKMGVIPGARLLSDAESYAVSELPANKDKPLVFYCGNTSCGASHTAASRAITAGYTHVKVLPVGIAGWVSAGKKTAQI